MQARSLSCDTVHRCVPTHANYGAFLPFLLFEVFKLNIIKIITKINQEQKAYFNTHKLCFTYSLKINNQKAIGSWFYKLLSLNIYTSIFITMHTIRKKQWVFEDMGLAIEKASFVNRGLLCLTISCHMHYTEKRLIAYMVKGVHKNKGLPGCRFICVRVYVCVYACVAVPPACCYCGAALLPRVRCHIAQVQRELKNAYSCVLLCAHENKYICSFICGFDC